MIGITDEPRPTGMGIFRAFGPRPASVTRTDLYYGGPSYIAGYCPTSEDTLYAYLVEDARDRSALQPGASGWRPCGSWPRPTTGPGTTSGRR